MITIEHSQYQFDGFYTTANMLWRELSRVPKDETAWVQMTFDDVDGRPEPTYVALFGLQGHEFTEETAAFLEDLLGTLILSCNMWGEDDDIIDEYQLEKCLNSGIRYDEGEWCDTIQSRFPGYKFVEAGDVQNE